MGNTKMQDVQKELQELLKNFVTKYQIRGAVIGVSFDNGTEIGSSVAIQHGPKVETAGLIFQLEKICERGLFLEKTHGASA